MLNKNKILNLIFACSLIFILLVFSKSLGLSWLEIIGVFIAILSFGVALWQAFKSINDTEISSIEDIEKELKELIAKNKQEFEIKNNFLIQEIQRIKEQLVLIPTLIQEQYSFKSELAAVMRDVEQLSAAISQASKYTAILKRQTNLEKMVSDRLNQLNKKIDDLQN